ncbi:MAG: ABC transporter permease [Propioniciclava sp.]|uniref:ABC transporter permease n=1 Tax=Propioniciclava sp. TaxID=2038686 RepID=UPI0039E42456
MSTRLSPADVVTTAWRGVAARPQRTVLASLGIAVAIAALVALTGVSASNRAHLLRQLDAMGADLAVVVPGVGPDREPVPLPFSAPAAIARQDGVARVGVFETAPENLGVYRTDLVPSTASAGITVAVARPDVLDAVGADLAAGRWFDEASRGLPVTVLGATAAERLGVRNAGDRVWIGERWYGVLGILSSAGLAAEIDTAALLGDRWVRDAFDGDTIGDVSAIYVRAEPGRIDQVSDLLAAAASPGWPHVGVTQLSDLAQARAATDDSLALLGVALAGIALLVGGVGIANTMVVAVMERRGEIGLRRSLGARPGQVAAQFVVEAAILSAIGGVGGAIAGVAVSAVIALVNAQPFVLAVDMLVAGSVVSVIVGALGGLQPAVRAARLSPTVALRSV